MDDRPAPAPELLAEARAFAKLIEDLVDNSDDTDTMRFTITVPRYVALLAAWVVFKEDMQRDGTATVLPRQVMLAFEGGGKTRDWQRAKAYLQRAVFREFDVDYTNLLMETHSLLHPSLPSEAKSVSVLSERMDDEDDVPF